MKKIIYLLILTFVSNFALGQKIQIEGKISNLEEKAVENAEISIKNSDVKVFSDENGFYSILSEVGDTLIIKSKGSVTREVLIGATSIELINGSNIVDVVVETEDLIFNMSLEELMNIKVKTASKTAQSLSESPASMIVITEQMIKDRGYHHLEEVLHDLPGFDFNKNYGVNYSTIFMRGYRSANSDRFILMFDGILENDIWKQTTWISRQYPVTQIKQIEVLYGPASALYGTNAFSGIINVITKKGGEVGDINLTTTAGSWGRKNIEISSGQDLSDDISYNFTFKYFSQDDLHRWDQFYAINGSDKNFSQSYLNEIGNKLLYSLDGKVIQEDFQQAIPNQSYAFHGNLRMGNLTFTALNWNKNELEAYFYNPFKRSGSWTEWFQNNQAYMLNHEQEINEKLFFSTNLTYRQHKITDSRESGNKYYSAPLTNPLDIDYAHSQSIIHDDITTYQLKPVSATLADGSNAYVTGKVYHYLMKTWDMTFEEQITYNLSEKVSFIGGAKYTHTNTQEDYEYGLNFNNMSVSPRHIKKTLAGYAQAMIIPIDAISLTLGGRYEDQKDEKGVGYNIFVPRASAVVKVRDNLIFRLQYAEAFQEADDWHKFSTAEERPYNSANLEPEKLKSFEIGTTIKIADKVLLSGAGYYTIVSNFIAAVDNAIAPYHGYNYGLHYENISGGEVYIYGYELNLNSQLSENLSTNINISGSFNYGPTEKMEQNDNGNYETILDNSGDPIMEEKVLIGDMTPFKLNLGLLYNHRNKFSIYPKVNFVSTIQTINWRADLATPMHREVESYAIIGINFNAINLFGLAEGLDFNFKIDNVFGSEYYNPGSRSADGTKYSAVVLQPGFNFMTGLSYQF